MDISSVVDQTNVNMYSVFPGTLEDTNGQYYCDVQKNDSPVCIELDWVEFNGNHGFALTPHTDHDRKPCDWGGCPKHFAMTNSQGCWGFENKLPYTGQGTVDFQLNVLEDGSFQLWIGQNNNWTLGWNGNESGWGSYDSGVSKDA